jgi:transcriptional antiterminator RfaH
MRVQTADDIARWYVVHTKPKQEERVNNNLMAWGVETLNPKLKARRYNQFTGAASYVTQPLFPRYLFAKFNANKLLPKIWFTRGVHAVVSFGGSPASIDDEIIQIIHAQIDESGFVRIGENLKRGDKVIIKAGPLKNFMGVFERDLKGNERVMVLLPAISYQGRVVVNRDLIEKAT